MRLGHGKISDQNKDVVFLNLSQLLTFKDSATLIDEKELENAQVEEDDKFQLGVKNIDEKSHDGIDNKFFVSDFFKDSEIIENM